MELGKRFKLTSVCSSLHTVCSTTQTPRVPRMWKRVTSTKTIGRSTPSGYGRRWRRAGKTDLRWEEGQKGGWGYLCFPGVLRLGAALGPRRERTFFPILKAGKEAGKEEHISTRLSERGRKRMEENERRELYQPRARHASKVGKQKQKTAHERKKESSPCSFDARKGDGEKTIDQSGI